jgi:hypothetical protein
MKLSNAFLATLGLLFPAYACAASTFDAALAACARTTQFCEKASYDEDLCEQARKSLPDCSADIGTGVLCSLKLDSIAPTQVSVGAHAAECKAKAKLQRSKSKIQRYLLRSARHVPAVIGPKNSAGNRFYITDHHHLSYALWYANQRGFTDVDTLYACVLANLKEDETNDFWSFMVSNHLTWLDNEHGLAIGPDELEEEAPDLKSMRNYPYRTWSRWVRDSCGYLKAGNDCVPPAYPAGAAYFMEFRWADYLHENLPGRDDIGNMSDAEIDQVIQQAVGVAQAPQAFLEDLPGYSDGSVLPVKYVEIKDGCEAD